MKGRIEILSSESESKFPNEAIWDILSLLLNLDMMKSNSPKPRTSCSAFNLCVCTRNRPQVKIPPQLNVLELVKTFSLKRLQLSTGTRQKPDHLIKIRVAKS